MIFNLDKYRNLYCLKRIVWRFRERQRFRSVFSWFSPLIRGRRTRKTKNKNRAKVLYRVRTFNFGIDRHRSTTRCVPNVLSVTAVRRVSLNLTVAAEWKTIVTSEHSLCLSSALRPRSGSDTSPLMHTTFSNTFSASSVDRMRSNTWERETTHPVNIE